jgi:hypothetical protein
MNGEHVSARPYTWLWALVLVTLLLSLSCVRPHGPEDVRHELSQTAGVKLDREFGITVTRSGVWLARKFVKYADDEEISLKGVRRIEVGVYQVEGLRRGREERARLSLDDLPGWTPIVRVHEDGEDVFVLTQEKDGRIHRLLVVVAEDDEWVLVRLKGKLEHIIEDAMRMAFDQADRPELYEVAREQRETDAALAVNLGEGP